MVAGTHVLTMERREVSEKILLSEDPQDLMVGGGGMHRA